MTQGEGIDRSGVVQGRSVVGQCSGDLASASIDFKAQATIGPPWDYRRLGRSGQYLSLLQGRHVVGHAKERDEM